MDVRTLAKETVEKFSEGMSDQQKKLLEDTLVKNFSPVIKEIEATKPVEVNDELIDKLIKEYGSELSPAEKEKARAVIKEVYVEGHTPGQAMNISKAILDWSYMNAYKLYQTGNFKEAIPTFRVLQWLDPTRFEFTFGLAACYQMIKDYENAIIWYLKLSARFPENPLPLFHAADCFKNKKLHSVCYATLQEVIRICGNDPRYSKIAEKSRLLAEAEKKLVYDQIVDQEK